jgi:diacylglycerol kinase family enzyme
MDGSGAELSTASPVVRIRRVEAVVNAASGSVGAGAADQLEQILARHGYGVRITDAEPKTIAAAVRAAVDAAPDLVIILAGDGTASLAARLVGKDGPLLAPLPGGTMNMLPHALYGSVGWRDALTLALEQGQARPIPGGEVDGRMFYVAAILGAPTLWAEAREAMRARRLRLAWLRARRAMTRTFSFSGSLHYTLGDGRAEKTEAFSLVCPTVSRGLIGADAFEAAALSPKDALQTLRLGFNAVLGDWRADPSVQTTLCRHGVAWARGRIPAVLDGEPCRLESKAEFRFEPAAFRALAPPSDAGPYLHPGPSLH